MSTDSASIKAKIQSKVKNPTCESCGSNHWDALVEQDGSYPAILAVPSDGGMVVPPPHIRTALLVCNNCGFVRQYIVK